MRTLQAVLILLVTSPIGSAQEVLGNADVRRVPSAPLTSADLARRESHTLYGLALIRQRQDRLVEATKLLEEATQIDADSIPVLRALAPLYFALGRGDEGLAAARKIVEREPGDHETWVLLGRQLKSQAKLDQAAAAYDRAVASKNLADRPDLRAQYLYELGVLREELGQVDLAVAAFLEVVAILDHPFALLELGALSRREIEEEAASTYERAIRLCIDAKKFERARNIYDGAVKKYPVLGPRLDLSVARIQLAENKPEAALVYLDRYLKPRPQGIDAYELKVQALEKLGRSREALAWLKQCVQADEQHDSLQLLLAKENVRQEHPGDAAQIYTTLLKKSADPQTYHALFELYRKNQSLGGIAKVLDEFNEAVASSGDRGERGRVETSAAAAAKARGMLAALRDDTPMSRDLVKEAHRRMKQGQDVDQQTRFFLAALAAQSSLLQEAEDLYRRTLDGPRGGAANEHAAYDGLLKVLWQGKKYSNVADVCRRGLAQAKATNRILFYHYLIYALLMTGEVQEALDQVQQAVPVAASNERDHLTFRLLRVKVLGQADKFDQALAEGQSLLKEASRPDDVRQVRYTLSALYSEHKDYPHSEEQLQLILKDDPRDAGANNDLGYIWADQNRNLDEAERLIRKALDLDREEKKDGKHVDMDGDHENVNYLDSLAWVLFRKGKTQEAAKLLEKAAHLARTDADPVIWDHLGDVYSRMDKKEAARKAWEKAATLFETDKRRKRDDQYNEVKRKLELVK